MIGNLPGTFLMVQFGSGLAQGRTIMTVVSGIGLVLSLLLGAFLGRRVYKELNAAPKPAPRPHEPPPMLPPAPRDFGLSRKDGLPSAS
jgi:hypothetical protein